MKRLWNTSKKTICFVVCIAAIVAGTGVIAAKSAHRSQALPRKNVESQADTDRNLADTSQRDALDEAVAAALKDAGLSESDVSFKKTELDRDHGRQVYDIEFYSDDTEYEYEIDASNGTVLEKSMQQFQVQTEPAGRAAESSGSTGGVDRAAEGTESPGGVDRASVDAESTGGADRTTVDAGSYIGVDRAKEIALNHANMSEADVQFAKAKLENDDGGMEYEIEFYFGGTEYDYTIDAVSENIIEYDVDYD